MPLYTTNAAPRARQGRLLVSWFAGPGALVLALLLVLPTTLYAQALDLIFANSGVNRVCLNDGSGSLG